MTLPKTGFMPEMELEWKIPEKSNAIERDRARAYHQAYSAIAALYHLEQALAEVRAGRTKSANMVKVPDNAVSVGFHEAARGVLSHHMVIRDGKVANYQPYPPTPWNANPRDTYGTPGPYEDAVQNTPIFEENGPDDFKGVDIMRAVHSFDPCLPCGVHMYTGKGKVRKVMHTPDRALLRPAWTPRPWSRASRSSPQLGRSATPSRGAAEELAGALMQLYGEGLERIFAPSLEDGSDALRARLVDDGVVGEPDADPRALSRVDLETRVREALDSVRPYMETHGGDVELLGIEDGVARLRLRGQLPRLRGVGLDARAGDQAGAAGGRARPRGDRGRGRVEEPVARDPAADGSAPASWMTCPGSSTSAPGAIAPSRSTTPAGGGQPRRRPARLPQRVRGVRRARWTDGAARGRDAELPVVRALVRAAARRPLDRGLRAAARAGAAAARGRSRAVAVAA